MQTNFHSIFICDPFIRFNSRCCTFMHINQSIAPIFQVLCAVEGTRIPHLVAPCYMHIPAQQSSSTVSYFSRASVFAIVLPIPAYIRNYFAHQYFIQRICHHITLLLVRLVSTFLCKALTIHIPYHIAYNSMLLLPRSR